MDKTTMEIQKENDIRMRVEVSTETRHFLQTVFKCARETVSRALNYSLNSDGARSIRSLALQHGGQVRMDAPACDTIHTSDGVMHQYFDNGYELHLNMKKGWVKVVKMEKVEFSRECRTIEELMVLQSMLQDLSRDDTLQPSSAEEADGQ